MMTENYKGYDIIILTDGAKNNEVWYEVFYDGVQVIHWYLRGSYSSSEAMRVVEHIIDSIKNPEAYPKVLMQP